MKKRDLWKDCEYWILTHLGGTVCKETKKLNTTGKQMSLPLAESRELTCIYNLLAFSLHQMLQSILSKTSLCETSPSYKPRKKYPSRLKRNLSPIFPSSNGLLQVKIKTGVVQTIHTNSEKQEQFASSTTYKHLSENRTKKSQTNIFTPIYRLLSA